MLYLPLNSTPHAAFYHITFVTVLLTGMYCISCKSLIPTFALFYIATYILVTRDNGIKLGSVILLLVSIVGYVTDLMKFNNIIV